MNKGIGSPAKRNEDVRLMTGRGLYVDDVHFPGMLHARVLRSTYAHARILSIDTSRAKKLKGVRAVYSASDLGELCGPLPPSVSPLPQYPVKTITHYALAKNKVRYVGEPVAFVVAEDRYVARDALELVEAEYEPLAPVVSVEKAIRPGTSLVHEELGSNIASHHVVRVGDIDKAFTAADHVIKERFVFSRGMAQSIETRGVVANYEPKTGFLTIWDSTQAPIPIRNGLAKLFGMPEHEVRVIAPDVGGGFGPKIMLYYPEEILVPFASIRLGAPVKWIEERWEYSVATNQERAQIHNVEVAFNRDGRILGIKDVFLHDTGAYTPYGVMVPIITLCTLPGPYKIPNYYVEFTSVFTNKTIVSPVRGAGRPTAVFLMERIMDIIARELKTDRAKVRFTNLIQSNEFPYDVGLVYQDAAPVRYDSGDYPALLKRLLETIEYRNWAGEKARLRAQNRFVGLGLALYVEGAGSGPYEMARVRVEPTGRVVVTTGVGTQGQGHYTTLAQIAADALGVQVEEVDVITGDTDQMSWGIGTFASRAATVAGSAVYLAAQEVRTKALEVAAKLLESSPPELILAGGQARKTSRPEKAVPLGELAVLANPLRGTLRSDPGLESTKYFSPQQSVFSSGGHAALVEVDPETANIRILEHVIVHDCGTIINPIIVEGQLIGGLSNGLGAAFYEEILYDENGQPLTITFADYLLPTAEEMPEKIILRHLETPSPLNPLGVKGVGEAGAIPIAATLASAIEDAIGVRVTEMPLNLHKLWAIIRKEGLA